MSVDPGTFLPFVSGAQPQTQTSVVQEGDFSGDGRRKVTPLFSWGGAITALPDAADPVFGSVTAEWSPGNQFLAVSDGTTRPTVYEVVSGRLFRLALLPVAANNIDDIAWSPDGRFLVGQATGAPRINVWEREGVAFSLITPTTVPGQGQVSWSPDSRYFAATSGNQTPFFHAYERTGAGLNTFTKLGNPAALPTSTCSAVVWAPHGGLIAALEGPGFDVVFGYRYDGSGTFVKVAGPAGPTEAGSSGRNLAWSPDGRHLAVGDANFTGVIVYRVAQDGSSWVKVATTPLVPGVTNMFHPSWSPDGRILNAVQTDFSPFVAFWIFDPVLETLTTLPLTLPVPGDADGASRAHWSHDQQLLALAHEFGAGPTGLTVYQTGTPMPDLSALNLDRVQLQGS